MARDAQNNCDRVDVEYYLQHVDHYTRVLTDITAIEAERFAQQREQQQASGGGEQPPADQNNNNNDQGGSDASGGGNEEPITTGGNQPRMTRQPRHQAPAPQQAAPQNRDDNGDIPLPGSALPAI
jgi:hypothetical protein